MGDTAVVAGMTSARKLLVIAVWVLACIVQAAFAAPWDASHDALQPVPPLRARVTDLTGTLSAGEQRSLETKLAQWEASTTNQLAVLLVATTQPETIEEFGIRVAEAWKIGQQGKDNGAIFIVAKNDKRMRIEVGYGLEGVLTDVTSRRIIAETVAPYFKQGQFAAGINAGVDRIMEVVGEGKPLPPAKQRNARHDGGFDFGTLLIILVVAVPIIGVILRSIFGNVGGSLVGAGVIGSLVWFIAGSLIIALIAAVIALIVIVFSMFAGRGGPGMWIPGSGGWSGGGGGGAGGFSGGGGSFGGGGASGGWD